MLQEPNIYVLSQCIHKHTGGSFLSKKYLKLPQLPTLPRFVQVQIHLLSSLPHATMPVLVEVYQTNQKYALILEPIYGDSLLQLVNQKLLAGSRFSQQQIRGIMYQLLSLTKHLHKRQYVVRDFKPEAMRFSKQDNNIFSLKVMSFFGTTKKKISLNRLVGSYAYMAPQILMNHTYDERCDVYSLGVILYILMTLNHPFSNRIYTISDEGKKSYCKQKIDGKTHKKAINFSDKRFLGYSYDLQRLCKRMLQFNPQKRISAMEAYSSQFLHQTWNYMQEKRNQTLDLTLNKDIFVMARSFGVSGFRKAVFKYCMPVLLGNNPDKREYYQELYRRIDLNADGVLSKFQLKRALKRVRGMRKEDRQFFVNQLTKKSGYVTKQDFILSSLVVDYCNDIQVIRQMFDYLDLDGNGSLSQQELMQIFKSDNEEFSSLQLMLFEDMDVNADQDITFEEFYDYLMKRQKPKKDPALGKVVAGTGGPQYKLFSPKPTKH